MIERAITRAYATMWARNWQKIYICVDLHDTCIVANYAQGGYSWLTVDPGHTPIPAILRELAGLPEIELILWSSCYPDEQPRIIEFFGQHGIPVNYFNTNPEVANTVTGDFSQKPYFSVLIDDKAGFDYHTDWQTVRDVIMEVR